MPPGSALPMWVIYDRPKDAPNHVVIRKWLVWSMPLYPGRRSVTCQCHSNGAVAYETVEQARRHCQSLALTRLPRQPGDDPVIVETWL